MRDFLLVWPRFPDSYWSFRAALRGTPHRAAIAPLPLLTVAGSIPAGARLRLWDENVRGPLRSVAGADVVLVSGMLVQARAIARVVELAARAGVTSVVGGPCATQEPERFAAATHLAVGELEGLPSDFWPSILERAPGRRWRAEPTPSIERAPVPRFDLVRPRDYNAHAVQFSRGCPFSCEFCDVIEIFGRRSRTKSAGQMIDELDALVATGFRGNVFLVDDNFIGNAKAAERFLDELARWQRRRGRPFSFFTEASVNLAERPELMAALVGAGFDSVFCGIETPDPELLRNARKRQNTARDLRESIARIQASGLAVKGGFILGFDGEGERIFDLQRRFIDEAAIPMAMVGLLRALPGTQLTRRLEREGRLLERGGDGDQFDVPNFRTTMDARALLSGYRAVLLDLYQPEAYFSRVRRLLDRIGPSAPRTPTPEWWLRSLVRVAVDLSRSFRTARAFWSGLARTVLRNPRLAGTFVTLAAQFRHFHEYTTSTVARRLERALDRVEPT